jgi:phosphoribosylformylglycinamidine synthase
MGADVSLDDVQLRQASMEPFEILTSESQERMLAICRPEDVDAVHEVCRRWGLASDAIGHLRSGGALRVKAGGTVVADVPARALADEGPVYERPARRPAGLDRLREDDPLDVPWAGSLEDAFVAVLGSPSVASKRWVSEQYDSIVQGGTVLGPGADAAVVRLEGTMKAVALAADGNGRYGHLDPYLGGAHAVAEAARNVAAVGARPLAITNCLNFGNPERAEVMWAFAESVRGISDACRALDTPVTGGNVSFYNEAADSAVYPTPIVGVVGVVDDYRLLVRPGFAAPGLSVYLLGDTLPELGGSEFAEVVLEKVSGRPPALDLEAEARLHRLLREAAVADLLASAHDCADGGLAVALAECAMAGGVGFTVTLPNGGMAPYVALFSESASRVVVTARDGSESDLEQLATVLGVPLLRLGLTGGTRLEFTGHLAMPLRDAVVVFEGTIPRLMSAAGG